MSEAIRFKQNSDTGLYYHRSVGKACSAAPTSGLGGYRPVEAVSVQAVARLNREIMISVLSVAGLLIALAILIQRARQ